MESRNEAAEAALPAPTQARADHMKEQAYGLAPSEPTPRAPPQNKDVPHLQGAGEVGSVLTVTMGNWTGDPTSYAYQWLRDGTSADSTGNDTYAVTAADAGCVITCVVTATNEVGSTDAPPSNAISVPAAAAAAAEETHAAAPQRRR